MAHRLSKRVLKVDKKNPTSSRPVALSTFLYSPQSHILPTPSNYSTVWRESHESRPVPIPLGGRAAWPHPPILITVNLCTDLRILVVFIRCVTIFLAEGSNIGQQQQQQQNLLHSSSNSVGHVTPSVQLLTRQCAVLVPGVLEVSFRAPKVTCRKTTSMFSTTPTGEDPEAVPLLQSTNSCV